MKGIVFTEFLEMIEKKYGYEMVDLILTKSNLESEGIYTSIGTYSHSEIIELLSNLSSETSIDPEILLKEFGIYIFDTFLASYPQFFSSSKNTFEFLQSIDSYIHVEVNKLYPDAALPKFNSETDSNGNLILVYKSERKMSSFAHGLIEKSIEFYKEDLLVSKEFLNKEGSEVKFRIIQK